MKESNFDLGMLEELSNLDVFIVKKPLNTPEFWTEWQEKVGRAYMSKIAIRKMMKLKKMNYEEYRKAKALIETYDEIIKYLEYVKNVALNAKGLHPSAPPNMEFLDEDDMDLDF